MRAKLILVVLGLVVLALVPSPSVAEPRCDQTAALCRGFESPTVEFGPCVNGQSTWSCCAWINDVYTCFGASSFCWCNNHGGCDCLLEGTPISLADGTTKPVEAIRGGDLVLAFDESTGAMIQSIVVKTHPPYVAPNYFIINERLRLTENHPLLSKGAWVAAGSLAIGDYLTSAGGQYTPIFSIRKVAGNVKVYNFQVAASTYVADGIIVHNKESCEEYVLYCPPGECP